MRRPYEVYTKYKDLLNKHLQKDVDALQQCCPENCKYNCKTQLGNISVRVCMFGQHPPDKGAPIDVPKLLVCETRSQAVTCNAFVNNFKSEAEIRGHLKEVLADPRKRREKYPDVLALEWVMDNELHEAKQGKPSLKHKLVFWLVEKLEKLLRQSA